mgnify:CR=1 FL=1
MLIAALARPKNANRESPGPTAVSPETMIDSHALASSVSASSTQACSTRCSLCIPLDAVLASKLKGSADQTVSSKQLASDQVGFVALTFNFAKNART